MTLSVVLGPLLRSPHTCCVRVLLQAREQLVSANSSLDAAKLDLKAAQDSKAALQVGRRRLGQAWSTSWQAVAGNETQAVPLRVEQQPGP